MADDQADWRFDTVLETEATKARLSRLLGGEDTPTFLFAALHGMGFPNGDKRQLPHQGALLCQDWPGPRRWKQPIPEDFHFSADDVGDDARLLGLMSFWFACYGAGTPQLDDFAHQAMGDRSAIAPHAFLARLLRGVQSQQNDPGTCDRVDRDVPVLAAFAHAELPKLPRFN